MTWCVGILLTACDVEVTKKQAIKIDIFVHFNVVKS